MSNYESVFDNGSVRVKLADTEDGIALSLDLLEDGEPSAGTTIYIGPEQINGMCAWLDKYRTPRSETRESDLETACYIGLAALGHFNTEQTDKHWNAQESVLREIQTRARAARSSIGRSSLADAIEQSPHQYTCFTSGERTEVVAALRSAAPSAIAPTIPPEVVAHARKWAALTYNPHECPPGSALVTAMCIDFAKAIVAATDGGTTP